MKHFLFYIMFFILIFSCRENNPRLEGGNKEDLSSSMKKIFLTCEYTLKEKRKFTKSKIVTWDDLKELDEYKTPIIGSSCKDLEGSENQSICEKKYKLTTFNKVPTGANNCEKLKSEVIFQVGYGSLDGLQVENTIELEQSVEAVIPSHVNSETGEKIANVDSFEIPVPNIIYFDGLVKPGFEFGVKKSNFMEIKFNEDNASKKQVRFLINLKKTTIGLKNCLGLDGSKNYDFTCERNVKFDNLTIPSEGRGQIYLRMIDKNGFLSKNEIVVNVPLNEKVIGWFNGGNIGCKKRLKVKDDCLIENMISYPYEPKYFKDKTKEELNNLLECSNYNKKVLEAVDYDDDSQDCPVVFKENGDVYGLINLAKKDISFRSTPLMGLGNCNNSGGNEKNCFVQFMNDKKSKVVFDPIIEEELFYLMDKKVNPGSENLKPSMSMRLNLISQKLLPNQFFDAYTDGSLCTVWGGGNYHCVNYLDYEINNSNNVVHHAPKREDTMFSPTFFYLNKRERYHELLDGDYETTFFIVFDGKFIDNFFKSINNSNLNNQTFSIYGSVLGDIPIKIQCSAQEKKCVFRDAIDRCHDNYEWKNGVGIEKTRLCPGYHFENTFQINEDTKCKSCPLILQVDFKVLGKANVASMPFLKILNEKSKDLDVMDVDEIKVNAKVKKIQKSIRINNEKSRYFTFVESDPNKEKVYVDNKEATLNKHYLFYLPLDFRSNPNQELTESTKFFPAYSNRYSENIGTYFYSKRSPTLNILDIRIYKNLSEENKENIYKNLMESYK